MRNTLTKELVLSADRAERKAYLNSAGEFTGAWFVTLHWENESRSFVVSPSFMRSDVSPWLNELSMSLRAKV